MFPSNTCNIGNDPIAFTHEQSLISHNKPYFLNETYNNIIINTISNPKQQFFYFPSSPLFEDESLFPHIHQNHLDLLLHNSPQPLFMRENNNFLSTSDKTHLLVSSTEPNINKSTINNNHKDPINLTNQNQPDDVSDLRKNHIRYDDDDRDDQRLQIPRKRMVVKKDRHSKIMMTTGKRPRHRRMRLSLEVARQFFDLQDMLGFERASKTVEWLLVQARSEIKKLAMESSTTSTITPTPTGAGGGVAKTANSNSNSGANSDCEVVSGLDEVAVNGDLSKPLAKEMKKRQLVSRPRGVFKRPRESRDKARERARERTKEKHMMKSQRALLGVVDHHHRLQYYDNQDLTISHGLSSWSMETGEEESATQSGQNNNNNSNNSLEAVVLQARSTTNHHHEFQEPLTSSWHNGQEQYRTTCTTAAANLVEECSFLNVGKYHWSPSSSIFNSPRNATTSGSSESIPQEHQFSHFQFFGNAWEACNNHKLC